MLLADALSPLEETMTRPIAAMAAEPTIVANARPNTTGDGYDAISGKEVAATMQHSRDWDLRFVSVEYSVDGDKVREENKNIEFGGVASDHDGRCRVRWPCLYFPSMERLASALVKHGIVPPAGEKYVKFQCSRLRLHRSIEMKKAGKEIGLSVVFLLGDQKTQPGARERAKYKLKIPIWIPEEEPVDFLSHFEGVEEEHKQLGTFKDAFDAAMLEDAVKIMAQMEEVTSFSCQAKSFWDAVEQGQHKLSSCGHNPSLAVPEETKTLSPFASNATAAPAGTEVRPGHSSFTYPVGELSAPRPPSPRDKTKIPASSSAMLLPPVGTVEGSQPFALGCSGAGAKKRTSSASHQGARKRKVVKTPPTEPHSIPLVPRFTIAELQATLGYENITLFAFAGRLAAQVREDAMALNITDYLHKDVLAYLEAVGDEIKPDVAGAQACGWAGVHLYETYKQWVHERKPAAIISSPSSPNALPETGSGASNNDEGC
jgi:hypothetical protein